MNVIINGPFLQVTDPMTLFGGDSEGIKMVHQQFTDLSQLMVHLGLYPSTSKARQAGRTGPIPTGWSEFKGNKRTPIWLWNPTE